MGARTPEPNFVGTDLMVLPATGEVVNLEDLTEVARAFKSVKELESLLREAKGTLSAAIQHHSRQQGTKTLHVEGVGKIEVRGGTETTYEPEGMEAAFREAGMPEERIREIIAETITYTVRAVEAKKAAGANPAYAAIVDAHKMVTEKRPSVSGP